MCVYLYIELRVFTGERMTGRVFWTNLFLFIVSDLIGLVLGR